MLYYVLSASEFDSNEFWKKNEARVRVEVIEQRRSGHSLSSSDLIVVQASSADSGLSRVRGGKMVRQLSHEAGDDLFISELPPLLTYAKQLPWSQRAS